MLQFVAPFVSQFTHMTSLSAFSHLPFITGSNCSTSYCTRMSHWWVYQSVTSANGLFERFWHYTVKQEDRNNLFCMTLGWWGGHFLFGWAVRSHQWLCHWAWCTSHKVWSFLLFCPRPHISLLFPSNFPVFTLAVVFSLQICRFIW